MTNHRLTFAAAIAVLAASLSMGSLLVGTRWLTASIGAVAAVALAGTLTRLTPLQSAIAGCAAALLAIVPVLAGYGWPGGAGALAVLAIIAASATGARLPRAFAAAATYVAVPFLYLNAVFAGSSSWAAVIPTAGSLAALGRLPARAATEFKYSPPIPTSRPVEFITVAGVTGVAICVDLLAVRLRRPAVAGLPLLLLFSVPVATSLKRFTIVQTLLFGLAIAAYLSLLSSDSRQRLRMWGRLVTIRRTHAGDETGQGPDTRQVAASGRRVGLTAVLLAMVVPVFLAGTPPTDLFAKTPTGGPGGGLAIPGGLAPLDSVGQFLTEKPRLELTYKTSNPDPGQQYLQEYVLNYDYAAGGRWLPSASTGRQVQQGQSLPYRVPGLTGAVPFRVVRTSVSLASLVNMPLPLPYAPVQVQAAGSTLTETAATLMVFATRPLSSPLFTVTSEEAEPTVASLEAPAAYPASISKVYTGYRGPDGRQLLRIARQHTTGARTALNKAIDLQQWFTSGAFTYTIRERWPGSGTWLLRFLTKDQRGDCEQFAPAFAVLARLLGIPSRVAIGFTGGTDVGGTWRVTTADAHAWPELYFPDAGWVRFEPTPSGGAGVAGQGTATSPPYTTSAAPDGAPQTQPSTAPSAGTTQGGKAKNLVNPKQVQAPQGASGTAGGRRAGFPWWALIVAAAVLLLAGPSLARWLTRRRRWLSASTDPARAKVAWREFLDTLTDYGIAPAASESPRAVARRVAAEAGLDQAAAAAVTRLGGAEERARYSLGSVPGSGLADDVATVRGALAAKASRVQRLRARLLPPSTLARALTAVQSSGRAFSWIDSPLPIWRRGRRRPEPGQAR